MNKLNHIAFIMDGNGRWGKKKGKGRNFGHLKGIETVKKIVKFSIKLNIPIVTFFVFSSENWKRPKKEISFLFKLISVYFTKEINDIIKQEIKINIFGENNKHIPLNKYKNNLLLFEYPANCRFCWGGCCCCLPPDGGFTSGVCIVVKFSASKERINLQI